MYPWMVMNAKKLWSLGPLALSALGYVGHKALLKPNGCGESEHDFGTSKGTQMIENDTY